MLVCWRTVSRSVLKEEVENDLTILGLSKGHLSMLVLLLENILQYNKKSKMHSFHIKHGSPKMIYLASGSQNN